MEDVRFLDNWALRYACDNGHLNVVTYLHREIGLTVDDLRSDDNYALYTACKYDHLDIVEYLQDNFELEEKEEQL